MDINGVADYLTLKACSAGTGLNVIKLQKLAYYSEAWHLAIYSRPLTGAEFQAWIHGPVNRELYDRFKDTKSLYSTVSVNDISQGFDPDKYDKQQISHLDDVLEAYAAFTGSQLEEMTHREQPWLTAREGYRSTERCEVVISPEEMKAYYGARLDKRVA